MADFTEEQSTALLLQFDQEFSQLCTDQVLGTKRDALLTEDLQGVLFAELVALANVARHMFMKIRYLQARIAQEDAKPVDLNMVKDFKKDL